MILSLIEQAGFNRFNTFVREKLSASLRMVALTTLVRSKLGAFSFVCLVVEMVRKYAAIPPPVAVHSEANNQ
jgi:hypothetical protein